MRPLVDAIFRANPAYELVLLERLTSAERARVGDLPENGALYGCLRPRRGSGLAWRSASSDTALLLLTLKEPGAIPAYLRTSLRGEIDKVVARLVWSSSSPRKPSARRRSTTR